LKTAEQMLDELINIYNAKYHDFTHTLELIDRILIYWKRKQRPERLK